MASELLERIWAGPYDGLLTSMGVLHRGDRHMVTSEDAKSAHWQPVPPKPAAKPAATDKTESPV